MRRESDVTADQDQAGYDPLSLFLEVLRAFVAGIFAFAAGFTGGALRDSNYLVAAGSAIVAGLAFVHVVVLCLELRSR